MNTWFFVSVASLVAIFIGYLMNHKALLFLKRVREQMVSAIANDMIIGTSRFTDRMDKGGFRWKILWGDFVLYLGLFVFLGGIFGVGLSLVKFFLS